MFQLSDFRPQIYYLITLENGSELEAKFLFSYNDILVFQIHVQGHGFTTVKWFSNQIQCYEEIGDFDHYSQWKNWDDQFQDNILDYES